MTGEIATQYAWLGPLAWQSTVCLAAGLAASIILQRRATRAHQVLLLAILAAVVVPALARVAKCSHWGLFVAERTVPRHTSASSPPTEFVTAETITRNDTIDESAPTMQPAGAVVSPAGPRTPRQIVLPLWLAVSAILLLRLAERFILGLRLARRSESVHCAAIEDALRSVGEKLGITGQVVVHGSNDVRSPVIWCWGRRAILLIPENAPQDNSLDWRSIVCHELAHWKRRDHVSGLFAELMVCILPWQPLLWWGRKRLMDLSEQACDDWVLASWQTGTRYARTLLGLTPQGYAALVPAVVAGRSGLGARVRRILAGQCADPHSSLHWTLAVMAVTACLSLGIALAQTRPAPGETWSKTALDGGAVIEQVASARSVKGRVLDPNGEPIGGDDLVRVTVLPATCYVVRADTEGCFELSWSPDWTGDGQKPRLLVRNDKRNLASLIEIPAPPAVITVQLEPGLVITGRVTDPNGRPIPKALTMLSLDDRFPCQAPLAATGTNDNGEFKILALPSGQMYKLTVWAEGHATSSAPLDARNASAKTFDARTITLTPRRSDLSDIDQSPNPNWKEDFLQTYRLDEHEVLKFVKPPFVPARQDHLISSFLSYGIGNAIENLSCVVSDTDHVCAGYRWDGELTHGPAFAAGGSLLPLQRIVNHILEIPDYDVNLPAETAPVGLQRGDWIVRKGTTAEERLKALEQIIAAELKRSIRFERRAAERDTIVVTGRYAFAPLPDKDPNRLLIFAGDAEAASWPDEAHSLSELFHTLADGIDMPIEDRSEAPAGTIRYLYEGSLRLPWGKGIDKEKDLPLLLDNLARQTGLRFKVERRTAPMWFVTERDDD